MRWWLVLLVLPLPALRAGVVGSFAGVRNLPGYIELQRKNEVYYNSVKISGKSNDDVEQRTASHILREDYLRADGTIDTDAIAAKILAIKRHENIAFLTYCIAKLPRHATHIDWCKSHADERMLAKWRKKKLAAAYAFVIAELQKAKTLGAKIHARDINRPSSQAFLEHLFQGLETFASITEQNIAHSNITTWLYNLKQHLGKMRIAHPHEAANLIIPMSLQQKYPQLREQVFFSPQQLQHFSRTEKLDIAKLDPLNSGFWRKPHSVRNFDTSNYNGLSGFPAAITDQQQEIAVTYDWNSKFTGLTPKMRVRYGGWKWKMKYLSSGFAIDQSDSFVRAFSNFRQTVSEVNSETVVNNLAAALGFTVDPTFFKANVRLYLPLDDPTDAKEFAHARQRLLVEQRKWGNNPDSVLAEVDSDDRGHWFIRLHSVSLERRSHKTSDLSVGSFVKGAFSRPLKREFRAFALFYAWVGDIDVKDDNANLVLAGQHGERKVIYSAADMGASLGGIFGNDAPNFFARDLVARVRRKPDQTLYEVVLNYRTIMGNRALNAISINDAKWMTRLIAQLSPTQIKQALQAAGYSALLSEYYTQILLRRRDQLLTAFGMMGETLIDAAGNRIVFKPESKMTDPRTYAVAGYEKFFRNGYLHDPQGLVSSNPTDLIRRYYDRNLRYFTPGTLQNTLWETVQALLKIKAASFINNSLQKLLITNRTFGLPLLDGGTCVEACFYDGIRVGISNFLPVRFLLENPYSDTDAKPLIVADVYRFGFLLGADIAEDFPSRFGIDVELDNSLPQLRYRRVYEFVKVRGIDAVTEGAPNLQDLLPLQILRHRDISMQLIQNLQAGEALIISKYISRAAGLRFGAYDIFTRPLLSSGFDLERITVGRKTLLRNTQGEFLLQFSDLRSTQLDLGVRGELILQDFPIINLEIKKLARTDLLFAFKDTPEHLRLIEENIVRTAPSDSIREMAINRRVIDNRKNKTSKLFNLAKFLFNEIDISSIVTTDRTQQRSELHVSTLENNASKPNNLPLLNTSRMLLRSFVTDDEQVFVELDMHYKRYISDRKYFAWIYDNALPLLGKPFIMFRPADVSWYLGKFTFHGQVYIVPAGLRKIMDYGTSLQYDFCITYARSAHRKWPRQWCEDLLNNFNSERQATRATRLFRDFHKRYVEAFHAWQRPQAQLPAAKRKKLLRAKAHAVARLFATGGFRPEVWRTLQAMAGDENIYRDGVLASQTGAFPAQSKEIRMPAVLQGGAGTAARTALARIVQSVEIFTDPLLGTLQEVFYVPMGDDIVPALRKLE